MTIGNNTIEFRRVRRRQVESSGGISWIESWQVRARDSGLAAWGAWKDIESEGFVYVDEAGAILPEA